jgi:hypothetical protein
MKGTASWLEKQPNGTWKKLFKIVEMNADGSWAVPVPLGREVELCGIQIEEISEAGATRKR